MKNFLRHLTENNLFIVVYTVCCSLLWIRDFLLPTPPDINYTLCVVGTYIGVLVNAFILMSFIWDIGVTKSRYTLTAALYILFLSSFPAFHTMWKVQLVVMVFQVVLLLILKIYRKPDAMQESFITTLLLCIVSLAIPDILIFIPILWIMLSVQMSFNLRVWLASITGAATVLLYIVLFDRLGYLPIGSISDICSRVSITQCGTMQLSALITISAESLLFVCYSILHFRDETHNTRTYVICFILCCITANVMMFFPPLNFPSLLIISILSLTGLMVYFYNKQHSVLSAVLFILHTIIWVSLWCFDIL